MANLLEDRFELKKRVGRGAWGEVFRAFDKESGVDVAVKRLHAHIDDATARERFEREVRMLARIDNDHVLKFVAEAVDKEKRPCLIVEWLEGEDLGQRIKRDPLTPPVAVAVVRQIALALGALHEEGIVHRDIKPANVFVLAGDGDVPKIKLLDLGVARANTEMTLTQAGLAIGTPHYMSPEQACGADRISPTSDIFSLGVVLFELLTHEKPFTGVDLFAVLAKIVLQELPRLRKHATNAPPEVDAFVARAMAKSPEDRFQNARDFVSALDRLPKLDAIHLVEKRRAYEDEELNVATASVALGMTGTVERRIITAVFAKLGRVDDKAASAFTAIAKEHGGVAHPLLGMNLVAVFGGARTTGDEVRRAALAALAIRARIQSVRVAVATGSALSGMVDLAGDVIERGAGDLERGGFGAIGAVRIDAPTARMLGEEFAIEEANGALLLRGERAQGGASGRTLLGKATPCVGRDRELAVLTATIDEVESDSVARAVLLLGAAGTGKSRIRAEILERVAPRKNPPLLLMARGDSLTVGSPLGLLSSALRRVAGVLDGEPIDVQRSKLTARLGRHLKLSERGKTVELLGEIASVPSVNEAAEKQPARAFEDAVLRGDRLRGAFEAWLAAESEVHPILIVLEDLHWGDLPSIKFVDSALRNLHDKPLMVLALARPEVKETFPDLFSGRDLMELPIGALSKKAASTLVRSVLGADVDPSLEKLLVDRADGNAFFLEELIRAVAEGRKDQAPGSGLPDTVLGVVQARLDALGNDAKRLLKAASIFGGAFWDGGVVAVLGAGERSALAGQLDDLCRREVITRRNAGSLPGEHEFTFRHALVRETAYAMLTEQDRALGHLLAGGWLEKMSDADPVLLAGHFERGGQPERALNWYLRAARQALLGNDFAGAIARAERAVMCGDKSGQAPLVEAEARRWRGDVEGAAKAAERAVDLLEVGSAAWFHAVREAVAANGRLGRVDAVEAWGAYARDAIATGNAVGPQVASLVPVAVHLIYAGRHDRAEGFVERVEQILSSGGEVEPIVMARVHQLRAMRRWHDEDPVGSAREHREALAQFERAGDLRSASLARGNLGFTESQLGRVDEAEELLREAHATGARLGLDTISALALHNLGAVLAARGHLEEARDVEARAVSEFVRVKDPRLEGASRIYLAGILCDLGDPSGGEREARTVLDATPNVPMRVGALGALARAQLLGARPAESLATARDAVAQLESIGAVEEFEVATYLVLGEALEANGLHDEARTTILDLAGRIEARAGKIRDLGVRDTLLHGVPVHRRTLELAAAWR